jgi:uncharacterized membrane protein YbhN (UPF0104 family)
MKSSRLGSIILALMSFGLVAFFIYFIYVNKDKYSNLLNISAPSVIILILISIAYPFINGGMNIYLLRSLGVHISLWDGFILGSASSLTNLLPFSGGLVTKALYLKSRYRISYTRFFGATLAGFVCFTASNGIIGLSILLYWIMAATREISPFLLLAFLLMSLSMLIFWFPFEKLNLSEKIRKRFVQILEGWLLISRKPDIVVKIVILQICLMLLMALRYWIAFRMISSNVLFSQCILFAAVYILEQIVGIMPSGLGIREGMVAAIAAALNFDVVVSIVAVELDRLVSTVVILLLGWLSMVLLGRQMIKLPNDNGDSVKADPSAEKDSDFRK